MPRFMELHQGSLRLFLVLTSLVASSATATASSSSVSTHRGTPALQQVDLSNNSFTNVEIWKPTNMNSDLIAVDLGFNSIEGYLPANFAAYPLLCSLSLRYNRFRGRVPLEYSKESLKRLYLDGNFLNGSPPDGFFNGGASVSSGSLGDNCLQKCPVSSQLYLKSQKPSSICRHAYGGKPRS